MTPLPKSEPDELSELHAQVEFAVTDPERWKKWPASAVDPIMSLIEAYTKKQIEAKLTKMRDEWAKWLTEPEDVDQCKISDVVAHFDLELKNLKQEPKQ